ncbi:hypothetical protein ARSEF4850_007560, partial [Beauveria asiatica]
MADAVVPGPEGNNRYGSETEGEGGSQHEEDSLDDDETRSADSDSAGSLADFVAPDWEILGGEEDEAVGDDDYEDEGSADEDEEEGDEGAAGDDDGDDDSPNRAYLPSRDAISRLEIIVYHLRRLARECESEAGQRARLHHPSCSCRRRGRRASWVPPPLRRAGSALVASHHNVESDASSPLSPNWRRGRRRTRGRREE